MTSLLPQESTGIVRRRNGELLRVLPWGKDGIRIQATLENEIADLPQALIDPPECAETCREEHPDGSALLRNGKLTVHLSENGRLSFRRTSDNTLLLEEKETTCALFQGREFNALGGAQLRFKGHPDERFYGLGQHQHGFLNQKGCVIELEHRNTETAIPFLVSSRGYGFLWNHPGTGRVELARNATRWVADSARQLDFYVTAGDSIPEILEHYADATGHPPPFPDWASGFWQCKLRYKNQEELINVAREYKARGLPLSAIVIDYFHWTHMGDWKFDPSEWPDPAGMVRTLDEMGVQLMVSVWPSVSPLSENWHEMTSRGWLAGSVHGSTVHLQIEDKGHERHMTLYDATNPGARDFLWSKIRDHYVRHGIKTFWLDACEPELNPAEHRNMRYALGPGAAVAGLYPLLHQKAFFDGLTAEGESDILTLCRSAWAGSQRYGASVWSGDIPSSFESLRRQIPAGLNMGLSGIPWWTTDIGGFSGGDPEDPLFRELLIRWFQYAVFCPIFRLHGNRKPGKGEEFGPNEAWSFGPDAYEIIRAQLFLRERLRPYLMEQMQAVQDHGTPPMRPLFVDFPEDAMAWENEDEFMFGPGILVAPVAEAGAQTRRVHLPAGTRWHDAWTRTVHEGGETVQAAAPLSCIPVYIRETRQDLLPLFSDSSPL